MARRPVPDPTPLQVKTNLIANDMEKTADDLYDAAAMACLEEQPTLVWMLIQRSHQLRARARSLRLHLGI